MSRSQYTALLFAAMAISITAFQPVQAQDPIYVIRPPAAVGMKSAGVLPQNAFAETTQPAQGGSGGSPGAPSSDGFVYKSASFEEFSQYVQPVKVNAKVGMAVAISMNGSGCRLRDDQNNASFSWTTIPNGFVFRPNSAGKYGVHAECEMQTDAQGNNYIMTGTFLITATP